ncbi:hypothetical protein RMB_07485 (plasmid) [Rickettsia massiliae str. AZT80]|uniref:Transposase n=1 Tax=Rickettsia massiliae str. AZT80 TaxID=1105112 RepID=H6QLC8_RICMA|nr:hypothetical protein RMB_07485 [Rickettsia massiliae str. AZT80]
MDLQMLTKLKELESENVRLKKMYAEERLRADKTINDCWSMDFIMHNSLENGRRYRYIMLYQVRFYAVGYTLRRLDSHQLFLTHFAWHTGGWT